MTDTPTLAHASGYGRVPAKWMRRPDIAPPAKALLALLCVYANADGTSWHSYKQLGADLGRSPASVCAYVGDLVRAGVLRVTRQTFGNGFNYRVRLTLVAWAMPPSRTPREARRSEVKVAGTEAETKVVRAECSVQPAERKDPSGLNQINENQAGHDVRTGGSREVVGDPELERRWVAFRRHDRDPVAVAQQDPERDLLVATIALARRMETAVGLIPPADARDRLAAGLLHFARDRGLVEPSSQAVRDLAAAVPLAFPTQASVDAALEVVRTRWPPHWKQLGLSEAMQEGMGDAARSAQPSAEAREACLRWCARASIASIWLRTLSHRIRDL